MAKVKRTRGTNAAGVEVEVSEMTHTTWIRPQLQAPPPSGRSPAGRRAGEKVRIRPDGSVEVLRPRKTSENPPADASGDVTNGHKPGPAGDAKNG